MSDTAGEDSAEEAALAIEGLSGVVFPAKMPPLVVRYALKDKVAVQESGAPA